MFEHRIDPCQGIGYIPLLISGNIQIYPIHLTSFPLLMLRFKHVSVYLIYHTTTNDVCLLNNYY